MDSLAVARSVRESADRAEAERQRARAVEVEQAMKLRNEQWKAKSQVAAAARKGDGAKAGKARDRQRAMEEEAEAERAALADDALFGGDSDDEEFDATAADVAAAECVTCAEYVAQGSAGMPPTDGTLYAWAQGSAFTHA